MTLRILIDSRIARGEKKTRGKRESEEAREREREREKRERERESQKNLHATADSTFSFRKGVALANPLAES